MLKIDKKLVSIQSKDNEKSRTVENKKEDKFIERRMNDSYKLPNFELNIDQFIGNSDYKPTKLKQFKKDPVLILTDDINNEKYKDYKKLLDQIDNEMNEPSVPIGENFKNLGESIDQFGQYIQQINSNIEQFDYKLENIINSLYIIQNTVDKNEHYVEDISNKIYLLNEK